MFSQNILSKQLTKENARRHRAGRRLSVARYDKYEKHMREAPPAQGLHERGPQLGAEIEGFKDEISSIDADIAKLQARRTSLVENIASKEGEYRGLEEQAKQALIDAEEESRKFSLQRISSSRIAVKEGVRLQALTDLALAVKALDKCL